MRRAVLISGAAGGIGRATARAFGAAGWDVAGIDVGAPPADAGLGAFTRGDVADAATWEAALAGLGRLDAVVNNAGFQVCKPLAETSPEEWDRVLAVNLRAAFLSVRAARGRLAAAGGAIVNVASVHAVATSENIAAYAASKGGLVAFTRAAALELAPEGIRVNAVLPGAVDTAMLEEGLVRVHGSGGDLDAPRAALARRTPLGRIGRPEDIASVIHFLADGAQSGFVTGQTLIADGGALARLSTE